MKPRLRHRCRNASNLLVAAMLCCAPAFAQVGEGEAVYRFVPDGEPAWISPENPTGERGAGGKENRGAKGHAFETIPAGGSHVLAEIDGPGIIDRMWLTIDDRSPERLRSLVLDIYWDNADRPAVSVPLGDFFLHGSGEMKPMETAFLASPEGRSFVSYFPMPFRKGARIVVRNQSDKQLSLIFFDINFRRVRAQPDDALYFHAHWHRDRATALGKSFELLPRVTGRGRFIGTSVTVQTNRQYGKSWWGEGEVKIALDGDRQPSLVGTGTEDYIGTAWGQGAYINRFQGAPVADEPAGRWTFYRFHLPDPIYFNRDVQVELQQIGGAPKADVLAMQKRGVRLLPVTIDPGSRINFQQLLKDDRPVTLDTPGLPAGWTNFYRSDDVAAVAYFYLDRPENGLAPIQDVTLRLADIRKPTPAAQPGSAPAP